MTRKVFFILAVCLCGAPWIDAPVALVAGFLFTLFWGNPYEKTVQDTTSILLQISVVGLGFGMNIHKVLDAGSDGLSLTILSIVFILIVGYFLGKRLKLNRCITHLISSGTAICGGSAIAAVAPTVEAKEEDISISLGVVFLLNSVALIIFPSLGHLLDLSEHQFGLWCAIAIHDTSSVVGAASAYGATALDTAVTVKLARALWIIPLAIGSAYFFKSKHKKVKLPWFIGLFIVAIIAHSYMPCLSHVSPTIVIIARALLVITLFLIGSALSITKMKAAGLHPLLLGIILWMAISVLSLFSIIHYY